MGTKPQKQYYTVKVREDLVRAARYDPDKALANYLRTKGYTVVLPPLPFIREWPYPHFATPYALSQQGKYWVSAKRERLVIKEMDLEYVANVLEYIRKHKPEVYRTGAFTSPLARALESRLNEARDGTDTYRDRYRHNRK